MASVTFKKVSKIYAGSLRAVDDLNLEIADGSFTILVGPSGCGKTTALRMVAGLEDITAGQLLIDDLEVNAVTPRDRDIAMVFQNYALYPHLSVFENMAFPLRAQHQSSALIKERVEQAAALLGLTEYLHRRPKSLSGGQRQRVAMGRAIVRQPKVFLMDEPLSNLDAKLRVQMRAEIRTLQQQLGVTTLYVTHDQVEAMTMGDNIIIMRKGIVQQQGAPKELYDRPANLFVATFIGSPAMNLFAADIVSTGHGLACVIEGKKRVLKLAPKYVDQLKKYDGRQIAIGVRPEHVQLGTEGECLAVPGVATLVESLGYEELVHVKVPLLPVLHQSIIELAKDADAGMAMNLQDKDTNFIARVSGTSNLKAGSKVELGLPQASLSYFDLESGIRIC